MLIVASPGKNEHQEVAATEIGSPCLLEKREATVV